MDIGYNGVGRFGVEGDGRFNTRYRVLNMLVLTGVVSGSGLSVLKSL